MGKTDRPTSASTAPVSSLEETAKTQRRTLRSNRRFPKRRRRRRRQRRSRPSTKITTSKTTTRNPSNLFRRATMYVNEEPPACHALCLHFISHGYILLAFCSFEFVLTGMASSSPCCLLSLYNALASYVQARCIQ